MKDHTQKEFEKRLNKAWERISQKRTPSEQQPKAYVLGGQPAAGKSGLSKKLKKHLKIMPLLLMAMIIVNIIKTTMNFKRNTDKMPVNILENLQVK